MVVGAIWAKRKVNYKMIMGIVMHGHIQRNLLIRGGIR